MFWPDLNPQSFAQVNSLMTKDIFAKPDYKIFSETVRLPGARVHQTVHGSIFSAQARQDGPRRRVLRVETSQGHGQRRQVRGRRVVVSAKHAKNATQRLNHQIRCKILYFTLFYLNLKLN